MPDDKRILIQAIPAKRLKDVTRMDEMPGKPLTLTTATPYRWAVGGQSAGGNQR